MKCLHKRNPAGGFIGRHGRICSMFGCDNNTVGHIYLGYWCANLCAKHVKYYSTRKDAEVSDKISIVEEEKMTA